MQNSSLKEWPEDERPRERLLRFGADSLSTAHLLAIILRTGGKNKSALSLAREMLLRFGDLKSMDDAAVAELQGIKGMGDAKTAQLKAAFELGRRLIQSANAVSESKQTFRNSRDVFDRYRARFYGMKKEKFICLLLDTKNRVFKESVISEGTLTASLVHPREVFRFAIKEAAASVLFIHNHPSGDPSPSRDDIEITHRLVETGKIVGIKVLDHVIIADDGYESVIL